MQKGRRKRKKDAEEERGGREAVGKEEENEGVFSGKRGREAKG
jgi:hypothetical protein